MRSRIVVGMSGGVDSSVAAALLKAEGHEVIGATMLVWTPPGMEMDHSDGCCGLAAAEDARRVCAVLGIRHYTLDFREVFYEKIVREYVEEYRRGHTPNPCVRCNQWIKFDALLARARSLGAEKVATGHYARVDFNPLRGRWVLRRGVDARKEQSYALYRLTQDQLGATLFPLGGMLKSEVRAMAAELGLPTAGKPDSQETCFVPDNDYPRLLQILAPETLTPGEFRSPGGEVLGRHAGVGAYTIGQRKRINVGSPVPMYVGEIRPSENAVVIAPRDHPIHAHFEVTAAEVNWVSLDAESLRNRSVTARCPLAVTARIRYNAADQPGELSILGDGDDCRLVVRFDQPVRGVSPGQSLVCYQGDELIVGGVLCAPNVGWGGKDVTGER